MTRTRTEVHVTPADITHRHVSTGCPHCSSPGRHPLTRDHGRPVATCRSCRDSFTVSIRRRPRFGWGVGRGWISGGVTVSRRGKVAFVVLAAAGAGTLAYAVAVGQVITCLGVFALAAAVQAFFDRLAGR